MEVHLFSISLNGPQFVQITL